LPAISYNFTFTATGWGIHRIARKSAVKTGLQGKPI
jgi:hypothetical protein